MARRTKKGAGDSPTTVNFGFEAKPWAAAEAHRSGRLKEIRAVKVWRMLHNLDFPSLYLELFTIQALSGRSQSTLAENVLHALRTIGTSLTSTRVEDPANTNNILSDDLTQAERQRIATLAAQSAREQSRGRIIW